MKKFFQFCIISQICMSLSIFAETLDEKKVLEIGVKESLRLKLEKTKLKEFNANLDEESSTSYPSVNLIIGQELRDSSDEPDIQQDKTLTELRVNYSISDLFKSNKKRKSINSMIKFQKHRIDTSSFFVENSLKREFYEALFYKELLSLYDSEIKQATLIKSLVSKKRKQGLVSESELVEIEMRASFLKEERIAFEEKYHHQLDEIRIISNLDHSKDFDVKGELKFSPVKLNINELASHLQKFDMELQENQLKMNSLKHELENAKIERLPNLYVSGRYGNMRIDEQYTTSPSREGLVGVYLDIPLFDGGKKKSVAKAYESRLESQRLLAKKQKNSSEIELRHKAEKLSNFNKRIDLVANSIKRVKSYYKQVRSEYERGVRSSLDLLGARENLLKFTKIRLDLIKNYMLTVLEIERMTGVKLRSLK